MRFLVQLTSGMEVRAVPSIELSEYYLTMRLLRKQRKNSSPAAGDTSKF